MLEAQPFSRLLGTSISRIDESGVQLWLDIRDKLRQQSGFIHGGVLSYLADNAITYACGLGLGADTKLVAVAQGTSMVRHRGA